MATVEIDADQLIKNLTQAISIAIQSSVAAHSAKQEEAIKFNDKQVELFQEVRKDPETVVKFEESFKRKRGRPRKENKLNSIPYKKLTEEERIEFSKNPLDEIVQVGDFTEKVNDILSYTPSLPPSEINKAANNYTFAAKRANFQPNTQKEGGYAEAEPLITKNRKMNFTDDKSVPPDMSLTKPGQKATYPEPEPTTRAARTLVKFTCSTCRQDFEDYWSNQPQALISQKDLSVGIASDERSLVKCNECSGRQST